MGDAERRNRVVGLDLSLTSTGMSDGFSYEVSQTDSSMELEARIEQIMWQVGRFACKSDTVLAVIESGAFSRGAQSQSAEILSALRFMVRHLLWCEDIPFAMVSPTCLKLYTAGNGKATKADMVAAVQARHGLNLTGLKVKDGRYDVADAFALAAMGYRHIGEPLTTSGPEGPEDSFNAVQWPELDRPQ